MTWPALFVEVIAGGAEFAYGWVRWAGADLLAMGVGALAVQNLDGGRAILRRMALVSSVGAAAAFAYAMVADEYDGADWFAIAIIVLNLAIAALLVLPAPSEA